MPVGASRAEKPPVAVSGEEREIKGRADDLPRAGLQLGERTPLVPPYPVVANFPTHAELTALLGGVSWSRAADVVLLDAGQPDGYLREWQPPGFPPVRHVAYAVQWFALAIALAVIYVVTNVRPSAGNLVNAIEPRQRSRQRRALIGLALLFFAPLALAFRFITDRAGAREAGSIMATSIDPPCRCPSWHCHERSIPVRLPRRPARRS